MNAIPSLLEDGIRAMPSARATREPRQSTLSRPKASVAIADLWPVFEFRLLDKDRRGIVLRYADGEWLPDDGQYDIAFMAYGAGAPMAYYVHLPHHRNILWSGLTTHWQGHVAQHPRGNPWHYMLRDGATEWGGYWNRDSHPNTRAGRAAMDECCRRNGCANGSGPEFNICDPYVVLGLIRERETKKVVEAPLNTLTCMYCGDGWIEGLVASADTHPKGGDVEQAPLVSGAVAKPDAQGDRP